MLLKEILNLDITVNLKNLNYDERVVTENI